MFQTEPNLWLQSLASPPLTTLLTTVTLLGYTPVYVVLAMALAFAFRLRPSLGVLGAILLAGMAIEAAKDFVAYPRPDEVDDRIRLGAVGPPTPLVARGGAASFWGKPSPHAIEVVRKRAAGNYGFPSGHVGAAAAFFLSAAWFFRSRRLLAFAAAWVPLMALSRMYLGRHFLADVLGGAAIGTVAAVLAALLLRPLDEEHAPRPRPLALVPAAVASLVLLVATPFVPVLHPLYVGGFAGLVLSYAIVLALGAAPDRGTTKQRLFRFALAVAVYAAASPLVAEFATSGGSQESRTRAVATAVFVITLTIAGTEVLLRRLRLYPRRAA